MTDKKVSKVTEVATPVAENVTKEVPVSEVPASPSRTRRHNSRMKKAIEGAQRMGATASVVEEPKGPTVIIAGVKIGPIATGLGPAGSSGDVYVHDGKEYYLPYHLLHNQHTRSNQDDYEPWGQRSNYKSPEMSLFAFVYDGVTFYLLMDEHSSFKRDAESYYPRSNGGVMIMINSTSHNDQFIDNNTLVNVESSNNLFNKSSLIVTSSVVGRQRGWGDSTPFKLGQKRPVYSNLRMKRVDCVDSLLSRGRYASSNFTKSAIIGGGDSTVTKTYLTECRIKGGDVTLQGLTGDDLEIEAKGGLLIKNVRTLKGQTWYFGGIHITNRFAFTEIDYLSRHDRGIKMVRISPTEVEVAIATWKEGIKLALDAPRPVIEASIREALREDKGEKKTDTAAFGNTGFGNHLAPYHPLDYRHGKPGDMIKSHMEGYIIDQVVSRLGMILLMDEIESCASSMATDLNSDHIDFFD